MAFAPSLDLTVTCEVGFGQVEFKMPVKHLGRQRNFRARSSLEMYRKVASMWVSPKARRCHAGNEVKMSGVQKSGKGAQKVEKNQRGGIARRKW